MCVSSAVVPRAVTNNIWLSVCSTSTGDEKSSEMAPELLACLLLPLVSDHVLMQP